jgi:hypothetical protein
VEEDAADYLPAGNFRRSIRRDVRVQQAPTLRMRMNRRILLFSCNVTPFYSGSSVSSQWLLSTGEWISQCKWPRAKISL